MKDDPVRPVSRATESFFTRMLNDARMMSAEDYYNRLPSMKQAVLADMAMGIQRSADAEEGIREQRMARAPRVFPAAMLNEQLGETITGLMAGSNEPIDLFVTPYELNPDVNERPRFIVGELNQDSISRRSPSGYSVPNAQNYLDEALSRLTPGQAIIITAGMGDYYTPEFSSAPRKVVVVKGEDGILYQREITPETYAAFKEAMRSGYPAGAEQLIIDEIASRSQMPRVRQDEVWSSFDAPLRQLNYYDDLTIDKDYKNGAGVAGYVFVGAPQAITAGKRVIPKENDYARALMEYAKDSGTNVSIPRSRTDEGMYVLQHEYGHVFDHSRPNPPSNSDEFLRTRTADAKANAKYINNFNPDSDISYRFGTITLGQPSSTQYAEGSAIEDFAEKEALWVSSKRYGRLGVDDNGNPVTFEDLFPNTAKYFENLFRRER